MNEEKANDSFEAYLQYSPGCYIIEQAENAAQPKILISTVNPNYTNNTYLDKSLLTYISIDICHIKALISLSEFLNSKVSISPEKDAINTLTGIKKIIRSANLGQIPILEPLYRKMDNDVLRCFYEFKADAKKKSWCVFYRENQQNH